MLVILTHFFFPAWYRFLNAYAICKIKRMRDANTSCINRRQCLTCGDIIVLKCKHKSGDVALCKLGAFLSPAALVTAFWNSQLKHRRRKRAPRAINKCALVTIPQIADFATIHYYRPEKRSCNLARPCPSRRARLHRAPQLSGAFIHVSRFAPFIIFILAINGVAAKLYARVYKYSFLVYSFYSHSQHRRTKLCALYNTSVHSCYFRNCKRYRCDICFPDVIDIGAKIFPTFSPFFPTFRRQWSRRHREIIAARMCLECKHFRQMNRVRRLRRIKLSLVRF